MTSRGFLRVLAVTVALAASAPAQQLPFQLSVTIGSSVVSAQNRSTITLSSAVGQPQTARVKAVALSTPSGVRHFSPARMPAASPGS